MNSYKTNSKLSLENLNAYYEELPILKDLSLHLQSGEFVSIIGPSGCGKSTIFNLVSGVLKPRSGEIYIDNQKHTGEVGRVSYMYQKDLLLPWRKIIDNVTLPLILKNVSRDDARKQVEDYFSLFGLEGFEDVYPHQLSGGMRQRAALMRTYMYKSDVILLDEPFGGLDAITKSKLQDWLLGLLPKLNASVLFITHDIEEAIYLSDRIYVLSERPAQIKKELIIDIPRPRERDITTSDHFNEIKREILHLL